MNTTPQQRHQLWLWLLPALCVVWGMVSLAGLGQRAWSGLLVSGEQRVLQVAPNSPAERAGLQAGDRITHINAMAVDAALKSGVLPVLRPGTVRSLNVLRGTQPLTVSVHYQALPSAGKRVAVMGVVAGWLAALWVTLCWWRLSCLSARVLLWAGTGLAMGMLGALPVGAPELASWLGLLRTALVLAGVAAVLHFLLIFPPRTSSDKAVVPRAVLYVPVLLFWVLLALPSLWPALSGMVASVAWVVSGLLVTVYGLLSLTVLLRQTIKADAAIKVAYGLKRMAWLTVMGVLPALMALLPMFAGLPGAEYAFVSLLLLPAAWGASLWQASAGLDHSNEDVIQPH